MLSNNENNRMIDQRFSNYIIQEQNRRKSGIAPDTIGVDYFFLLGFITPQMEDDFPAIEHEFLTNCRAKIVEFNEIGWYGAADIFTYEPIQSLYVNILRLIYNGAKSKDNYCVELLKTLYKTYHKKEYNQLKRFNKLGGEDIINLSENLDNPLVEKNNIAIALVMADLMGIKIDDKCSLFYYVLADERNIHLAELGKHVETSTFTAETIKEYSQLVENWMSEALNSGLSKDEVYAPYLEAVSFISECFKKFGFSDDYMQLCTAEEGSRALNLIYSLAILKQLNPKKEYELKDLYIHSSIVQLITAFTDIVYDYNCEVGYLIGDQLDESEMEDVLFKPSSINIKKPKEDAKANVLVNLAPISNDTATKEDYKQEINELRGKLKTKERDIQFLRDKLRILKQGNDEESRKLEILEADRAELIKLRNFVYNLKDEDIPKEDELQKMKAYISEKRILIIGGHQNWLNKLKKDFPGWTVMHMDESKIITTTMLEKRDYVFFYSDYLSHKSYEKCVAMLRDNNISFGYLHGVNMDNTIKQVYEQIDK